MAFLVNFSRSAIAGDTPAATVVAPSPFPVVASFIRTNQEARKRNSWIHGFQISNLTPDFLIHYLPQGGKNASSSERHASRQMALAGARLGRINSGSGLLAVELDA